MIELRRLVCLTLFLSALGLAAYCYIQILPDTAAAHALSESGLFEQLSLIFWAMLSIYIIWRWWPGSADSWAIAMLPLIALAREASLHKSLYGMSVLKFKFYLAPHIALSSKLITGAIVITLISSLFYGLYLACCWLKQGAVKRSSGQFVLTGIIVLLTTKVLDRMNAILRADFNILLSEHVAETIVVLEESFEMALPLIFLIAAHYAWQERQAHGKH